MFWKSKDFKDVIEQQEMQIIIIMHICIIYKIGKSIGIKISAPHAMNSFSRAEIRLKNQVTQPFKDGDYFSREFQDFTKFDLFFCLHKRSFPQRGQYLEKHEIRDFVSYFGRTLTALCALKYVSNGRSIILEDVLTWAIWKHYLTLAW